jgi:hypothetical protein
MKNKLSIFFIIMLCAIVILSACSSQAPLPETTPPVATQTTIPANTPVATLTPAPSSTPAAKPEPMQMPGDVPEPIRILQDNDSSPYASLKYVTSGDNPLKNLYERPFTQGEMTYLADTDILSVSVALDANFYYFSLTLKGIDPASQYLAGSYAIEIDRNLTGRGNLLVVARGLKANWSMDNLMVYEDKNKDVGGPNPVIADRGFKGDGYESQVSLSGDITAFSRLKPGDVRVVQIAVSKKLIGVEGKFLWGAWAYRMELNPTWFDLDDHFGKSEAGSPIRASGDYPLNAVHSLDNTCRLNFGFFPSGIIPGMCISGPQASHPGEACSCIRPDLLSGICNKWYCK